MSLSSYDVFSKEEREIIKRAAAAEERSMNNYVRAVVLARLRQTGYLPPAVPFAPVLLGPKEHK